ncbi:unnamed protein product, partial [Linum tenue]
KTTQRRARRATFRQRLFAHLTNLLHRLPLPPLVILRRHQPPYPSLDLLRRHHHPTVPPVIHLDLFRQPQLLHQLKRIQLLLRVHWPRPDRHTKPYALQHRVPPAV